MTKFILTKTWTILGVLSFTLTFMLMLGLFEHHIHQEGEHLKKHLSSLNNLAIRSHEAATLIKAHEKDFAAFEACGFERSFSSEGLPSTPAYTTEFGSVSTLSNETKDKDLIFQEVSFSIPCLYDREVFKLLDKLINEGPGVFQIQEVTIKRMSPLSEEMLEMIAAGKPQILFDGRIKALWIHR